MISKRGAALSVMLALPGCEEQTLTEADCVIVKKRLEAAWERDALAAQSEENGDVFLRFVRDERDRVGADWMEKCSPLIGRPVRPDELACIQRVETIDDVYECTR